MLYDKLIKKELKKQGIKEYNFDSFKLKNPSRYSKLILQYKIHNLTGVNEFKKAVSLHSRQKYF